MSVTTWAWNRWYVIERDVQDTTVVGRLLDGHDAATVRKEVRAPLGSVAQRTFAGMIARDTQERADWFQSKVRKPTGFLK